MSKLLTVVIPVYNVEIYIDQCLESFLIPEIMDDLELLVIDDGSSDTSAERVHRYLNEYPDSIRLISKENGGHGSAINRGIEEAAGKYFKVVDGDDWVDGKALKKLIAFLKREDCDLIYTNYYWVSEKNGKKKHERAVPFAGVEYGKIYSFREIAKKCFIKMHNMTIRTSILKEHCPPIDEHCFYVDNEYILFPIPFVRTTAFLDVTVYQYRIGRAEQSVNIKKMQERCGQHEYVLYHLFSFYKEKKAELSSEVENYLAKGIARMVCSQIKIYLSYRPEEKYRKKIMDLDLKLKQEYPSIDQAVENRAVFLLRVSKYSLYRVGAILFRCIHKL